VLPPKAESLDHQVPGAFGEDFRVMGDDFDARRKTIQEMDSRAKLTVRE
jgi:hypothetical protein